MGNIPLGENFFTLAYPNYFSKGKGGRVFNASKDKLRIDYFIILLFIYSLFFISNCTPLTTQSDPSHRQRKIDPYRLKRLYWKLTQERGELGKQ
jgi:hypothetical protein